MKTSITKPLVQFVLVTTLLTILFRISLSELLNNQMWSLVFIPPVIYFILMYVSGRFFGIKEYEYFRQYPFKSYSTKLLPNLSLF